MIAEYPFGLLHDIGIIYNYDNPTDDQVNGLEYAISTLSDKDQRLLDLRYKEYKTYREIGTIFNLTGSRIGQMLNKVLRRLRWHRIGGYIKYGYDGYPAIKAAEEAEAEAKYAAIDPAVTSVLPLEEAELSVRSFNVLNRMGFNIMRDVVDFINEKGANWYTNDPHCSKSAALEIMYKLKELKLIDDSNPGWEGLVEYKMPKYPNELLRAICVHNYNTPTDDQVKGLEYAISQLPDRNRLIINLRYKESKTYDELASIFNLSRESIRQIIYKSIRQLTKYNLRKYAYYGYDSILATEAEDKDATNLNRKLNLNESILSARACNALRKSHYYAFTTMGDVVDFINQKGAGWYNNIRNCGEVSALEIMNCLKELRLVDNDNPGWEGLKK